MTWSLATFAPVIDKSSGSCGSTAKWVHRIHGLRTTKPDGVTMARRPQGTTAAIARPAQVSLDLNRT
jgi:hypothetical protein